MGAEGKQGYGSIPTNVQVVAPSTLGEGYTFDAMYEGVTFKVTVPEGGVSEGQRFIVPFTPPPSQPSAAGAIPTGVWRDGLCACFSLGLCHPQFLNAWLCRPILLAQLLTRMKMTWLGEPMRPVPENARHAALGGGMSGVALGAGRDARWKDTFHTVLKLMVAYYVLMALTTTQQQVDPTTASAAPYATVPRADLTPAERAKAWLNQALSAAFFFYILFILVRLRRTIREAYDIPEETCTCIDGGEDLACACCCPLCVTAQMARHTADYDHRQAACCTAVGLKEWDENEWVNEDGDVIKPTEHASLNV